MDQDITLDDLDIDLRELVVPPSRGRVERAEVTHFVAGELDESHIATLISVPMGSETPSISKLKHSHHHLARLIGEGRTQTAAAQITGYSVSRVSILMDDPAFQELVEHYRSQTEEVYINVHERLASLGLDALQELHDRLIDPEAPEMANKELMNIIELVMPMAGFGPKTTQVNEFKFSIDGLLGAVKDEVRTRQNGRITTLEARPVQSESSDHFGLADGLDIDLSSLEYSTESGEGSEGRGAPVREEGGQVPPRPANENGGS